MVEPRVDRRSRRGAARRRCRATTRPSSLLDPAPIARSPAAIAGDPVRFLEPQLGEAAQRASSRARRRRRRRRSGYSSIIRGAISGGTSMPRERRRGGRSRSATGSFEASRAVREGDVAAHLAQHVVKAGAGRIDADALDPDLRARHDQSGDGEEGGGRGVAGDGEVPRLELGLAAQRDAAARRIAISAPNRAASARDGRGSARLSTIGDAGRVERGEQQRRFDLRRGDFEPVVRRDGGQSALDGQRQPVAARSARRSAAAAPRPGPSAGGISEASPVKAARIGWLATRPMSSRADVPELPRSSGAAGLEQAADADSVDRPGRRPRRSRSARPSPEARRRSRRRRRRRLSPSIRLRPTASAARISARWEMLLSPGSALRAGFRGRSMHGPWL